MSLRHIVYITKYKLKANNPLSVNCLIASVCAQSFYVMLCALLSFIIFGLMFLHESSAVNMDLSHTAKEGKHVSEFVKAREMVHDPTAFTQGLVVHDGILVSRYCQLR